MREIARLVPEVVENHTFLPWLLREEPIVLDFGLNHANFAMTLIRRHSALVFGAEPSAELFQALPSHPRLRADPVAIGGRDGTAWLALHADRCASLQRGASDDGSNCEQVAVCSFRTFLQRHDITTVDLLKVDIEGAECDLFENALPSDLRRCDQITVEFHDFMTPSLSERVEAIKSRIAALGFVRINFSRNNGDVLFVRRALLSPATGLLLAGPIKYAMGASRRVSRFLRPTRSPLR